MEVGAAVARRRSLSPVGATFAYPAHDSGAARRNWKTVGVLIWILVGALVGWLVSRLAPARLPGGVWVYCLGGTAGGFVGGGVVALLTGRNAATVDLLGVVVAVAGAAVLVLIVRKAAHAEPRTRAR